MMESIDIAILRSNVSIHHWVQCWLTHPFIIVLEGREDGRKMKRQDVITMPMRLNMKRSERNHIAYFLKGPFLQLGILSGFPRPTIDVDFVGKTWWCGNSFAVFPLSRRSQIIGSSTIQFFSSHRTTATTTFSRIVVDTTETKINKSIPPSFSIFVVGASSSQLLLWSSLACQLYNIRRKKKIIIIII